MHSSAARVRVAVALPPRLTVKESRQYRAGHPSDGQHPFRSLLGPSVDSLSGERMRRHLVPPQRTIWIWRAESAR
jgi:hypothetical protein